MWLRDAVRFRSILSPAFGGVEDGRECCVLRQYGCSPASGAADVRDLQRSSSRAVGATFRIPEQDEL